MRKAFVAKNRKKRLGFKIMGLLVIVYISLVITFNILLKTSITDYFKKESFKEDLLSLGTNRKKLLNFDLLNPKDMFKVGLNYALDVDSPAPVTEDLEILEKYENDLLPRVYIYNSHDSESYDSTLLESYNIKYTVKMASYILSEKLRDLGIPSYVEAEKMTDYLRQNGLNYNHSYQASRFYLEKRLAEHPSIELIIDLHRDAVNAKVSRVEIDGKNYARMMFVVGTDYNYFESNSLLADAVNNHLDKRLSRGVSRKSGAGVNGVYNQDLFSQALLIEVGGVENTIEDVANSLEALAKAIFEVLGEKT